jgi:carboxylesterase
MKIREGAESFTFKRGDVCCLLIHGFTGSPWEMREMGEFLAEKNISVIAPRLPGHGTTPEDMFNTRWQNWYGEVEKSYNEAKKISKEVFCAGLSMGGLLTLHLATHCELKGIIPMAAPVYLREIKLLFIPILKTSLGKIIQKFYKYDREVGKDIKDKSMIDKIICYDKTPVPCAISLIELMNHTRDELSKITAPCLIIQSKYDHTVPPGNAKYIYERISSKDKEIFYLENSYHVITVDYDKEKVFNKVYEFIRKFSKIC